MTKKFKVPMRIGDENVLYNIRFDDSLNLRLRKEEVTAMMKIIGLLPEKYASVSHYMRVAIIKLNREEKEKLKVKK